MANSSTYRLVMGILVGVGLSFFSVYFYNMMDLISQIQSYTQTNIIKAVAIAIGSNFRFDFVSVWTGTPTTLGFFIPQLIIFHFAVDKHPKFEEFEFWILKLFRISCFGIWILVSRSFRMTSS